MSDVGLDTILNGMTPDNDAWTAHIPETWMQGRTAYGGLSSGLLIGAALRQHADLPPVRSALINFTGPVGATPRITTEILRQGRNVTTVLAKAEMDGQTATVGTFSFGASRDNDIRYDRPAPPADAPDACDPLIPDFAQSFAPRFQTNFETRLIAGDRPMARADHGYTRNWARHRDPASRTGSASLLCLADILPPAVYPMMTQMGRNSSMTWICNFLDDDLSTEDGWWHAETDLSGARDGYSSQVMRVWSSDGRLVIDGMQAVAIF